MTDLADRSKREVDISRYARAAAQETLQQEGVVRMHAGIAAKLGLRKTPGVTARIDDEGRLQLDVSVVVRYGTDLGKLGPVIQKAILTRIGHISNQPIGQINVIFADTECGNEDLEQEEGCHR